jgi:hypothetical protein
MPCGGRCTGQAQKGTFQKLCIKLIKLKFIKTAHNLIIGTVQTKEKKHCKPGGGSNL